MCAQKRNDSIVIGVLKISYTEKRSDQRYKIMDVRKDNSKQWRSYKKVEVQYVNKKGQKKWKSTNDDKIYSKFNPSYPRKPLQIEEHKHERNESLLIKYKSNEPKLRKIGELAGLSIFRMLKNFFSSISSKIRRSKMEHKVIKSSLDSKLQIHSICSIRVLNFLEDSEKLSFLKIAKC